MISFPDYKCNNIHCVAFFKREVKRKVWNRPWTYHLETTRVDLLGHLLSLSDVNGTVCSVLELKLGTWSFITWECHGPLIYLFIFGSLARSSVLWQFSPYQLPSCNWQSPIIIGAHLTRQNTKRESCITFLDWKNHKQKRDWLSVLTTSHVGGAVVSGVELAYEIFAPLTGIFCSFKTFHLHRVLHLLEFSDADNKIHPSWFKWDLLWDISWLTDSLKRCRSTLQATFPWTFPRTTPRD